MGQELLAILVEHSSARLNQDIFLGAHASTHSHNGSAISEKLYKDIEEAKIKYSIELVSQPDEHSQHADWRAIYSSNSSFSSLNCHSVDKKKKRFRNGAVQRGHQ